MNARIIALHSRLVLPLTAEAQGFAGLGTDAEGFALPAPDPEFQFPADHGPHPDFRIEWWYVTANLEAADGTAYGLQWTLFRTALSPGEGDGWTSPQVWFGHAALTTPEAHFATERYARGGIGQAGVTARSVRCLDRRMATLGAVLRRSVDDCARDRTSATTCG